VVDAGRLDIGRDAPTGFQRSCLNNGHICGNWYGQISEEFLGHSSFHKTLGFLCHSVRESSLETNFCPSSEIRVRFNLIKKKI
jgi:hypothetical protein